MRRVPAVLSSVLFTVTALVGCGSEGPEAEGSTGDPGVIEITFEDGEVTPQGERVEVTSGEPVEVRIKSDEAGELHVHSSPEQELEYDSGTTTHQLTIDEPGVVEVEAHDPDVVVVQLEVR